MWRETDWLSKASKQFDPKRLQVYIPWKHNEADQAELLRYKAAQFLNEFITDTSQRVHLIDFRRAYAMKQLHYRFFIFLKESRNFFLSLPERRKFSADLIWAGTAFLFYNCCEKIKPLN